MRQGSNGDIVYKKTQIVPFYLRADKPVCCENRVKNLRVQVYFFSLWERISTDLFFQGRTSIPY